MNTKIKGSLTRNQTKVVRRLPVVSLGAEHLVIGFLMRRNVLAYKAPPNNEGYDIICIHPDPKKVTKQIRIQIKSRYQTDCDRGFPVKARTFTAFDYLVIVFLNIGHFYSKTPCRDGLCAPEFYVLPVDWIRKHHKITASGWDKVHTRNESLDSYKNEQGFDLIADELGIDYPA